MTAVCLWLYVTPQSVSQFAAVPVYVTPQSVSQFAAVPVRTDAWQAARGDWRDLEGRNQKMLWFSNMVCWLVARGDGGGMLGHVEGCRKQTARL